MKFRFGKEGVGLVMDAPSFELANKSYNKLIDDLNNAIQNGNTKFKKEKHIVKIS